jgi:hypothetical protein
METRKMTRTGLPSIAPPVVTQPAVTTPGVTQPGVTQPAGVHDVEWTASPLRPVAHWVAMPIGKGRSRLEMVWEVPDPIAPSVG